MRRNQVYSIFGQIEAVAAETMVERGLARRIPVDQIPEEVAFDVGGNLALFAIWFYDPLHNAPVFEELIAKLRA